MTDPSIGVLRQNSVLPLTGALGNPADVHDCSDGLIDAPPLSVVAM